MNDHFYDLVMGFSVITVKEKIIRSITCRFVIGTE